MHRFVLLLVVPLCGCGRTNSPPASPSTNRETDATEHSHERDKMVLRDLGPRLHAGLTAHLSSKNGNELDVFIETADAMKPAPLPLAKFTAKDVTAAGKEHELGFEPAEMDERKDDPPGMCSHFVAKTPWMKADEPVTIMASIEMDGKIHFVKWANFLPKKYAHHIE